MPAPIPFARRLPPHLLPPPARAPETDEQRRTRQLALTRELAELNMLAARDAADRIVNRDGADQAPAAQDPTLALARATRATTSVIALENRIAAGERAAAFTADDPRALALRELLHPLVAREPDPVRRRTLRARVNERIDDALAADLDDDLPLAEVAVVIAAEHGLTLDLATIPDEYLDLPATPPGRFPFPRPEADSRDQR
ncbi:MAG: hypothetical protein RQ966_06990 [Acetobacteraceae bacterium]|nr:hypothetical protein [Acetobacteraceae bacterium]